MTPTVRSCVISVTCAIVVSVVTPALAAAKPVLVLRPFKGSVALKPGAELDVFGELQLLEGGKELYPGMLCQIVTKGTLTRNQASKDKASLVSGEVGCPPETLELLGFPWTFEMTTKGVGELIGHRKLGIVLPGPCVYEARTIAGDFELEAFSEIDAGAVLGRNAHRSLATCASSLEMSIAFWPFNNSEGLVDAELRG